MLSLLDETFADRETTAVASSSYNNMGQHFLKYIDDKLFTTIINLISQVKNVFIIPISLALQFLIVA